MTIKHRYSLDINGYQTIKIPKYIIKEIKNSLIKLLSKNLNINQKKKVKNLLKYISNKICNIKNKDFIKSFGHVSLRYLPKKSSKIFNKWVCKNLPKILNKDKSSLHYTFNVDRSYNKSLSHKQFCIYFRCVRPNKKSDVGQPHRDIDFWKLIKKKDIPIAPFIYKNIYRLWIPIYGCNNKNSLKFFDKSHTDEKIKTNYYLKMGRKKPKLNKIFLKKYKNKTVQPIKNFSSQGVLFTDKTIHYAPINKNKYKTRISVECSIVTL